ncbi:TPA: hypothetical protein ACNEZI_004547 [Escherichia coli]
MNSNSINEFISKKAAAVWVWLNKLAAYTISIVLPIIGANVEKWLKPFLDKIDAPEFLKTDFAVYGSVFGVCGVLATIAVKRLVVIDARFNSEDAYKIRELKKENKSLRLKNKKLYTEKQKDKELHEAKLSQSIADCENKNKQEIDSLKKKHEEAFARKIDDHEREVRRLQEYIKLQEVAMDAMKNYKSVEQDIREYNVSGNTRKIHIDD